MIAEAEAIRLHPKVFVNGFPKAGTHLALGLIAGLVKPWHADGDTNDYYLGTFHHNSFSEEWMPKRELTWAVLNQPAGTWLKGHCGYFPQLAQAFNAFGTGVVNIYRDLRDVTVSMAHHIEGNPEKFKHSERDLYANLSHEETMIAIIEGIGRDPGLIKRWEYFAPWLDVDWVLNLRFEDVITDKRHAIEAAVNYCISRTATHHNLEAVMSGDEYIELIEQTLYYLNRPEEYSKTFRKGKIGEWRREFTPAVAAAFDAAGGNEWNERLGYDAIG